MTNSKSAGAGQQRARVLQTVDSFAKPEPSAFRAVPAPRPVELDEYRVVEDRAVRDQLVSVGLAEIVQRPGPGNWKKTKPPATILRIYPNFDAPAREQRTKSPRDGRVAPTLKLPGALVHDLRTKWEAYYADTRPESQRRHEQRAQSIDPTQVANRARQLIEDARRERRPISTRDAMLTATDEMTTDFETAMRVKYGDLVIDMLGIPDATDQRPSDK